MFVETKEGGVNAQRTFVSLSGREGGGWNRRGVGRGRRGVKDMDGGKKQGKSHKSDFFSLSSLSSLSA